MFTYKNANGKNFFSRYYQRCLHVKDKKDYKTNILKSSVNQGILAEYQLGKLQGGTVSKQIFFIWLGPDLKRLRTFLPNVVNAININSGYKVMLLIDGAVFDKEKPFVNMIEIAMQEYLFDNKRFAIVDVDRWQDFKCSQYFHQYNDEVNGYDVNYSAAADILRYYALYKFGGIYVDIDDRVVKPFGKIKLKYGMGVSGYTTLFDSKKEFLFLSPIASIKHSPAMKYVLIRATKSYLNQVLYADTKYSNASVRHRNPYRVFGSNKLAKKVKMNSVLTTSGNIMFTDALTDIFPNLKDDSYLTKIGCHAEVACLNGYVETGFTGAWLNKK